MKKTFRISLRAEEHEELIRMIENCPRSFRNELFILALKMLNQHKSNLMLGQNQNTPKKDNISAEESNRVEKQLNTSEINITDIFKF